MIGWPHANAIGIATTHSTVSAPVTPRSRTSNRACVAARRAATATPAAATEPASRNIQFECDTSVVTATAERHSTIHARQNARPSSTM